jgi:hypothetical protein
MLSHISDFFCSVNGFMAAQINHASEPFRLPEEYLFYSGMSVNGAMARIPQIQTK